MALHNQGHALNAADHTVGTTAATDQLVLVGTDDAPAVVEVNVDAPGVGAAAATIVRRAADGHIAAPTSGQTDGEVLTQGQVIALIAAGVFRPQVHSVVADHTAATVGDTTPTGDQTSNVALFVGAIVINTTDDKLYTVTSIAGGTTGNLVTYDAGVVPITAEFRTSTSSEHQWVFDTEGAVWVDTGVSSHTQLHAMTSTADHSANNWKIHFSNGANQVVELALGTARAPLLAAGAAAAPIFGALLLGSAVISAAGTTPIDTDVSAEPNDSHGVIIGTGGRIWNYFKNATDVYYVELTAI